MNKEILKKLREARAHIKASDLLKKDGNNDYGKYDYYTPELVEKLVTQAEVATGTITVCNFEKDEFGLYQELIFMELENPDNKIVFKYRTKHGNITATNETQQMGGTDTYSERYIKMKVFNIKDNSIDPDAKGSLTDEEKAQIEILENHESEISMIDDGTDLKDYFNEHKQSMSGTTKKRFTAIVNKQAHIIRKRNENL